jgi:hypothetical protein
MNILIFSAGVESMRAAKTLTSLFEFLSHQANKEGLQIFVRDAADEELRWPRSDSDWLDPKSVAVFCFTATNQQDPYLLFQAGALSDRVKNFALVIDVDGVPSVLRKFMLLRWTEKDLRQLFDHVAHSLGIERSPEITDTFRHWWAGRGERLKDFQIPGFEQMLKELARSAHVQGLQVGNVDIPGGYRKIMEPLEEFLADKERRCDEYRKNVFIMTRFVTGNIPLECIDKTIRTALDSNGLVGHRADDRIYPGDRNLWDNVCTYMIGCSRGIAVLEDIIEDEFNPNVALEYGFMRALGKPTLLLKEKRMKPRADILGTIWEPFNMFEIETSIKAAIDRWSRDVGPHL